MTWLFLLFSTLHFQYLADLPLQPVGFDGGELKQTFNRTADQTRMIVVFSPT